jgi:GT2 family glycosyltransferase
MDVGFMNENLPRGEDNEYNYRILEKGYKVLFDPNIISIYYARKTAKESALQMYANGISIGKLIKINYKIINIRHIVPFLFVISLMVFFIFGLLFTFFNFLFLFVILSYVLINLTSSIVISYKNGSKFLFVLPFLFTIVHFCYGIGTFVGLVKK